MTDQDVLYLDHNATTPCDPRVVEEMLPYFTSEFWNPSSTHALGRRAARVLSTSRQRISSALGVTEARVIFTSGATEAIQLALERLPVDLLNQLGVFSSKLEHRAVQNSLSRLRKRGTRVTFLAITDAGSIDVASIQQPAVYVIQAANSETGVLQPIDRIGERIRSAGGLFICDAAQALWKVADLNAIFEAADAVILSAHKAYGPKGSGLLIATPEFQRLLSADDGPQNVIGLREGTANVAAAVGTAACLEIVASEAQIWRQRARSARDFFESGISQASEHIAPLFCGYQRVPNTSSIWFKQVPADLMIANSPQVAMSFGSACSSGTPSPPESLLALGINELAASQVLRCSFGRDATEEEVEQAILSLAETYCHLSQG